MHTIAAGFPARPQAARDRDITIRDITIRDTAIRDTADRDREARPSRLSVLLEALAYAGASVDPIAALAAQRFARVRDEAQGHGRW